MKNQFWFIIILCGFLFSCKASYTGSADTSTFYKPGETNSTATDSALLVTIVPYQEKLNKVMNDVLTFSTSSMEKAQPEGTLGNFVADACLVMATNSYHPVDLQGIDFCVLNNGGLRSSLPSGSITRKNVFELMPFENELVVLTLNGSTVKGLLNYISAKGGVPVSNLRMKISTDSFSDAFINEKQFEPAHNYKILTSDYLAYGGDAMELFSERISMEFINLKVRDAIINYMQTQDTLKPKLDGRISR